MMLPCLRKQEGMKVLISDNLSSHQRQRATEACDMHNIAFICLPPNATHLLQPLDAAFSALLKEYWRQILREWKMNARG